MNANNVIREACQFFEIDLERFLSTDRSQEMVDIRKMVTDLLLKEGYTPNRIGIYLQRDRTTVLHFKKTFEDLYLTDKLFKKRYQNLRDALYK